MPTITVNPSDVAGDVLFIHGSLNTEGAADAFAELMDLVHSVLVPNPNQDAVKALQFAVDVFRGEH
jgi:hypothetical protein